MVTRRAYLRVMKPESGADSYTYPLTRDKVDGGRMDEKSRSKKWDDAVRPVPEHLLVHATSLLSFR